MKFLKQLFVLVAVLSIAQAALGIHSIYVNEDTGESFELSVEGDTGEVEHNVMKTAQYVPKHYYRTLRERSSLVEKDVDT